MSTIIDFFKRYSVGIQFALVFVAFLFLTYQVSRPLVDYDEATYAKVVVDTMKTGDISTFQLSGSNWFEKPPLYFWMSMGSVALFGNHEFSFRLPSILLSLLLLWLVYRLVKELSGDDLVATLTFLILLFSKLFLMFAREARTDQGLLLGIFAALFFFIKGWKDRRYLFWIFPAIAVGFMFKSVVAFLAFPTILIYAAFYNQWSWIKDKYLWAGAAFSLALLVPWHLLETIRFGMVFWDNYLGVQIFQRATTTLTGTDNPYDYIVLLILNYKPWLLILLIESVLVLSVSLSKRLRARIHFSHLLPPLLTGVFIVTVFSLAKTHLPTYILPALPFFAMYIAFSYQYLLNLISRSSVRIFTIAVSALFVSSYIFSSVASALDQVTSVTYEEQSLGQIYKNNPPGTLYSFGWPVLSTINYYSATSARYLDASTEGGKLLKAPLYFIVQASTAPQGLKVLYRGNSLMLLYSDHDIQLPSL